MINLTDLDIIIHTIVKTSQAHPGDISLQKGSLFLAPHAHAEILPSQPVTRGDRLHVHYHFTTINNHKTVRSLPGTAHVEIK